MSLLLGAAALGWSTLVRADVASDRAAAILVFPKIAVRQIPVGTPPEVTLSRDTLIQIGNTSDHQVNLHCFYIDANSHCSISGLVCDPNRRTSCPMPEENCLPGWVETDFDVYLTPQQPLAWRASTGLSRGDLPLDGVHVPGPGGASNVGTAVPPVAAEQSFEGFSNTTSNTPVLGEAFTGELRCVVVDAQGHAIASNVVKGEGTIVTTVTLMGALDQAPSTTTAGDNGYSIRVTPLSSDTQNDATGSQTTTALPTAEKYNAIGIQAIDGDANGDNVLELGGDSNEYNGCASVLVMDHFFDLGVDPVSYKTIQSELTLVPCSQDLVSQVPGKTPVQFLVFNEFEQRFSTSAPVDCYFQKPLSLIDTRSPERSIFSVYVEGTLTGQTRIRGVSGGLIGLLTERRSVFFGEPFSLFDTFAANSDSLGDEIFASSHDAAVNLHMQGQRPSPDRIVLP